MYCVSCEVRSECICYVEESRPLWSSGQSSWLQIQRSRFDSPALPDLLRSSGSGTGSIQPHEYNLHRNYLKKKSNGSGLENRDYCHGDLPRWLCDTFYPQKLALTALTSGSRSVSRGSSLTRATEFSLVLITTDPFLSYSLIKTLYLFLISIHATCPVNPLLFFKHNISWRLHSMKLLIMGHSLV
jgi:hypothetical protein